METHDCLVCKFKSKSKREYNKHLKTDIHKYNTEHLNDFFYIKKDEKLMEGFDKDKILKEVNTETISDPSFKVLMNVDDESNSDTLERMLKIYYYMSKNEEYTNHKYKSIIYHNLCRIISMLNKGNQLEKDIEILKEENETLNGEYLKAFHFVQVSLECIEKYKNEISLLKEEIAQLKASRNQTG